MQVERSKNIGLFIEEIEKVNQQAKNDISLVDLKTFLKNNLGLVGQTELSSDLFVNLKEALETLKTRIKSTKFPNEKIEKIEKTVDKFNFFEGLEDSSKIPSMLKTAQIKGLNFTRLDLTQNYEITDELLKEILMICPHLEYLAIHDHKGISSESLKDLIKLKNLKTLKLQGFGSIVDSTLEQVISKLTTLHYLNLSRCDEITDEGIKYLVSLKDLEKLVVSNNQITTKALENVIKDLPNLELENVIMEY